MIKFELKCAEGHRFEAWFRNSDSYEEQAAAHAIHCPACGGRDVGKAPMAPSIARSGSRQRDVGADAAKAAELMQQLRELRQKVESSADYVGDQFAEEARKIHYGEVETRAIYGETTTKQAEELKEEGISFARIPWVPTHNS
ncbi:DUF1178 family protein [Indioceanicola profundi]|uniref:DUF1178 family protein n=1 Tax=Indioceanicola profundi TaxID=2220096 RepID=UPI000E6ABC3F|nr:DUF1178 family protein [Indioceanicola profundi]